MRQLRISHGDLLGSYTE